MELRQKGYRRGGTPHVYLGPVGLRTDLLPFGPMEENRAISFSNTDHIALSMIGFTEALPRKISFELEDGTIFSTPDVAGMILLKLNAWSEMYPSAKAVKHVRDIGLLLDAFFDGTIDLLESDPEFSGILDSLDDPQPLFHSAVVIGRQISAMSRNYPTTLARLVKIRDMIRMDESELFLTPFASATLTDKMSALKAAMFLFEADEIK